jgi:hypothetical protein
MVALALQGITKSVDDLFPKCVEEEFSEVQIQETA